MARPPSSVKRKQLSLLVKESLVGNPMNPGDAHIWADGIPRGLSGAVEEFLEERVTLDKARNPKRYQKKTVVMPKPVTAPAVESTAQAA